jgi:hypothetical protein
MSQYYDNDRHTPEPELQWLENGVHDLAGVVWAAVVKLANCVVALFKAIDAMF